MMLYQKITTVTTIALLFTIVNNNSAFAVDFSSSNFIIRDPVISTGGNRSTGSNLELFSATGQIAPGETTSTNFINRGGLLYFHGTGVPYLTQNTFRWYDAIDAIQPTVALADENTRAFNTITGQSVRLRLAIKSDNEPLGTNNTFKLQYAEQGPTYASCSAIPTGSFIDVGSIGGSPTWSGVNFESITDGQQITATLLTTAANGTRQSIEEQNPSVGNPAVISIGQTLDGEWDWIVRYNGLNNGKIYCFRQVFANNILLDQYTQYPSIKVKLDPPEIAATPTITVATSSNAGGSTTTTKVTPPEKTRVEFKGKAYPGTTGTAGSKVTILKDGMKIVSSSAKASGEFDFFLDFDTPGTFNFSLYSEDSKGQKSTSVTKEVTIKKETTVIVEGIEIPPTIYINKAQVKKGEALRIYGQSFPKESIAITIKNSTDTYSAKTQALGDGTYSYYFDTGGLNYGKDEVWSQTANSPSSTVISFNVGTKSVLASDIQLCVKCDLNKEGFINLLDFSILLFWYGKNIPSFVKTANFNPDLNNDGVIDLKDISILLYYWTG